MQGMKHPAGVALLALALQGCGSRHSTPPAQSSAEPAVRTSAPTAKVLEPAKPAALASGADAAADPRLPEMRVAPACSFLTAAEVSEVLKGPIGKPAEKDAEGTSTCSYPPLDMTSYQQAQIDIEWHGAHQSTLEDTMARTFAGSTAGREVAHEAALGDSSSYSREGILRIHAGEALISITLMMRPDSEGKAMALGRLLLARMGYASAPQAPTDDAHREPARQNSHESEVVKGLSLGEDCPTPDEQSKASFARAVQDEKSAIVPFKPGLTWAYLWTEGGATPQDHECLNQVVTVAEGYVDITESCGFANEQHSQNRRRICRQDLLDGQIFHPAIWAHGPAVISPTTLFSLSSGTLHALKTAGRAPHRWLQLYPNPTRAQATKVDVNATLLVDPAAPKFFSVLVNDKLAQLPVVTSASKKAAKTDDDDDDAVSPLVQQLQAAVLSDEPPKEDPDGTGRYAMIATVLDDERFPLMLDYQVPGKDYRIKVTKITYESQPEMEQQLAAKEEVTVYGIYFDFASDTLRPESTPVLEEIAAILHKNADWKLSVTGHTDNVGGNAANLELSRRRAAAVKVALIERYHIDGSRLVTDGAGAGAPQATNETPEGRARNRRVVLRRTS